MLDGDYCPRHTTTSLKLKLASTHFPQVHGALRMAMQWHMEALFMISAVMEALFMISAVMIQAPKLQLVSHVVSPNFHKKKKTKQKLLHRLAQ